MIRSLDQYPQGYSQNVESLHSSSPDGRFFVKFDSTGIEITNLKHSDTALFYNLDGVSGVAFYPDNRYLLVFFVDGRVWFEAISSWEQRLVDLESGYTYYARDLRPELVINTEDRAVLGASVSEDKSRIVFKLKGKSIQIWRASDLTKIATIEIPSWPAKFAFGPDGILFATSSDDKLIRLWDLHNGQLSTVLKGHQGKINALAYSPNGQLLASLEDKWVYIWGILPEAGSQVAGITASAVVDRIATATYTQVALPKPTSTPTSSLPSFEASLPLSWPVAMPSNQEISEARLCDIETLTTQRYPAEMDYWQLESAYRLESACDWAALAAAYVSHTASGDPLPDEGKRAFVQAIQQNPALAFNDPLFYTYFDSLNLVAPPIFAQNPIASMTIDYHWSGIGEPSSIYYHIKIAKANLSDQKVKVTIQADPADILKGVSAVISPTLVQAVRSDLVDFLPIQSSITLELCTDNSPEWKVGLTFTDGTLAILDTYSSNMLTSGGPWQVTVADQHYLQYSTKLLGVFMDIFQALNLPLGQPWGSYCNQVDVLDLAYPRK